MSSRSILVSLLLLSSAVGCGGAAKQQAAAPAAGAPAAVCSALGPHVMRFSESLQDASELVQPRLSSYAGLLELLLTFERSSAELEAQMATAKSTDRDFAAKLERAQAALSKANDATRLARQRLEKSAATMAPLAQESDAAYRELRGYCTPKRKPAECGALERVLASMDKGGGAAKGVEELSAIPTKNARFSKLRDRAVAATKTLLATVEKEKAETTAQFEEWAKLQKGIGAALEGLATTCKDTPVDGGEGRFVAEEKPDPRKLTVLVRVRLPSGIEGRLEQLAEAAENEYERAFYEARAQGGFGSGFIVVRTMPSGAKDTLVITNRHVVELSDRAELELADGTELGPAEIVYTDPMHDVAVLRPSKDLGIEKGFAFSRAAAKDQQVIIAAGFPGMGGRPSYQIARGYVSNQSFDLQLGSHKVTYVQHTAPIDPGSSGGPLTDERGSVLGLNTLKVTNREAVALAVPSPSILETIRRADAFEARRASSAQRRDGARLACLAFVGELATKKPRLLAIESMISNELTAEHGLSASGALSDDPQFERLWENDSVRAMRVATLLRVNASIAEAGGASVIDTCSELVSEDKSSAVFRIRLANWETRTLGVRVEHGHWKVAHLDVPVSAPKPAPAKPKPAPAKPKGKKR